MSATDETEPGEAIIQAEPGWVRILLPGSGVIEYLSLTPQQARFMAGCLMAKSVEAQNTALSSVELFDDLLAKIPAKERVATACGIFAQMMSDSGAMGAALRASSKMKSADANAMLIRLNIGNETEIATLAREFNEAQAAQGNQTEGESQINTPFFTRRKEPRQ